MARILIVDDNQMVRNFLKTLLGSRGHELCEAEQGTDALQVAQFHRPDLIITDILMPEMDGFEFIRRLRADQEIGNTPAIFYTATYHSLEAKSLAKQCGVNYVLEKPAHARELFQAVDATLGRTAVSAMPQSQGNAEFDTVHLRLVNQKLGQKIKEVQELGSKLEVLTETGRRMIVERDLERLIQVFCVAARDILVAKAGVVRIFAEPGGKDYFAECGLDRPDVSVIEAIPNIRAFINELKTGRRAVNAVDGSGNWSSASNVVHSFLGVPISSSGKCFGLLYAVDKVGSANFSDEDQRLAGLVAAQIAVTYENAIRHEQVQSYIANLELLSRRFIDAQETERRRVARELHDGVGQALTAIKINLQAFERVPVEDFKPYWEDALEILGQLTEEVRTLSLELRPSILDDLGLLHALEWHISRFRQRVNCEVDFFCDPLENRLPVDIETACFRITQEALTNISKHAKARRVTVELLKDRDELCLIIRDDGVGFNVLRARERAVRGNTVGLLGMEERMRLLSGTIEVSSAPGEGTEIRARFPLS